MLLKLIALENLLLNKLNIKFAKFLICTEVDITEVLGDKRQ